MSERKPAGGADSAANRAPQRQKEKQEEATILAAAAKNLDRVNTLLKDSPTLHTWLRVSENPITLARERRLVWIGPGFGAAPAFPKPQVWTSRIALTTIGGVVQHRLEVKPHEGPFKDEQDIDRLATPDLLKSLWDSNEARRLIRSFAKMSPIQIERRTLQGVK